MAGVIAYTLPAMQLVCHLVVSGPSGTNVTESVPYTTQSPPQDNIHTSLPDGYVANLNLGFAYKHHTEGLTWIQARNACEREGAKLTVIDSVEKMEYIGSLVPGSYVHAGIFSPSNDTWINVNTGEPVTSIVWGSGEPSGSLECAEFLAGESGSGLASFRYDDSEDFFCEIPILHNQSFMSIKSEICAIFLISSAAL